MSYDVMWSLCLTAGQYHRRISAAYFDWTDIVPHNWVQEFELLNLPLFTEQYIRLIHVPLDVMQEYLKLQLEFKAPQQPSLYSMKQVRGGGGREGEGRGGVERGSGGKRDKGKRGKEQGRKGRDRKREKVNLLISSSLQYVYSYREALQLAIEVRKFYLDNIEVIAHGDPAKLEQVEGDIATFEEDLRSVLEVRGGERGGRCVHKTLCICIHTRTHATHAGVL